MTSGKKDSILTETWNCILNYEFDVNNGVLGLSGGWQDTPGVNFT